MSTTVSLPRRTKTEHAFGPREVATLAALLALTFSLGVGEFVVLGLLPAVAADFGVTVVAAGWVVTGYALGVALGGPVVAILGLRLPRRRLILGQGLFLAVTMLASGLAPSFGLLMTARVLTAVVHGAFVGVAVVTATRLVPPRHAGMAVTAVVGGFTAATVVGVPFGTLLGQRIGWRAVFVVVALLAAVGWAGIAALLPGEQGEDTRSLGVRAELQAALRPQVLRALAMTALGFGGLFAAFTYIAPFLTGVTELTEGAVPMVLFVFGVGALIGNVVGGRASDANMLRTLRVLLTTLAVALALLPILGANRYAAVGLLLVTGAAAFGATPGLQLLVVRAAGASPLLSSTLNISAFNVGNALGAFGGGIVLAVWGSPQFAPWVGAVMAATAAVLARTILRREPHEAWPPAGRDGRPHRTSRSVRRAGAVSPSPGAS